MGGIDRPGVSDVLAQMGNPLDALAPRGDVVTRLHELSEGDPLLLRLYVEALLPYGGRAPTLGPEDLEELRPGLQAYMERWFEEQLKLWGKESPMRDRAVRGLLNLCATALGPLFKDDVLALARGEIEDSLVTEDAARAVSRFLIGDGVSSGYVFSHPRLGQYFGEKLSAGERRDWQERFLRYGRDTLVVLQSGTLQPRDAPAYVVQYYGAHLEHAEASDDDVYGLICEGWLRAWEWVEGTPAGFLTDVGRAWARADSAGPTRLGQQVRAALCLASVTSVSAGIPTDLLLAGVGVGVVSPVLGLVMARQKPEPADRARNLAGMVGLLPSSERAAVLAEALDAARQIGDESDRAWVFEELATHLPASLLAEALGAARQIGDQSERARALGELAPHLPAPLLAEALGMARQIGNESLRARALGGLAPRLAAEQRAAVLAEALGAARQIGNESERAWALGELAPRLAEEQCTAVLAEALGAARQIGDEFDRARALGELAPRLAEEQRAAVLAEALDAARQIGDESLRARAFGGLASHLPARRLAEALSVARQIGDEFRRAMAFGELVPHLAEEQRAAVLAEALGAARQIGNESERAWALGELAPHLPARLLAEALGVAHEIGDESARAWAFGELAPHLTEEQRAAVLAEALGVARQIRGKSERAMALGKLAPHLAEEQRSAVLAEALDAARQIGDESTRAGVLGELAPHLPAPLLVDALQLARALSGQEDSAGVLVRAGIHWVAICQICGVSEFAELSATLQAFAQAGRGQLLGAIRALVPVIERVGGRKVLRETAQAIVETAQWWP